MVSAREIADLLDERPDLEPAVEAVLEPDPPWSFHDVAVDSGRFGELVAQGVVEKTDAGYRVADPDAVSRGLAGNLPTEPARDRWFRPTDAVPVDRLELGLLAVVVALVVGFRLIPWSTVYRQGHVVLSGNDPYYYRYLVEQLLASPDVQLSALPGGLLHGEPLLVVTLWLATLVFGGSQAAAGHVLAWYPVVSAALTAAFVYGMTVAVTDDRRVGLAAVAMLAVLPGHALRTSLGFADHHAFDYLWLSVTVFGLALLARQAHRRAPLRSTRTLTGVFAVAIGVTAQMLAWEAGPLLIAAVGPVLAFETLRAVHADESPLRTAGPMVIGVAVAAGLVWIVHDRVGWHTELVALAPLLVLFGGLAVVAVGELFHRLDLPAVALGVAEAAVAAVGLFVFRSSRPDDWQRLIANVDSRLLAPRPIAEVHSIFSDTLGWLLLFGFLLLLAVPYLVWATSRAPDDARWIPPVVYAWYFLALSGIQARFVGELSPVIVVFAGLGFVHIAERVDLAPRPAPLADVSPPALDFPDPRQLAHLALLFGLIASLSIVQVPVMTSLVMTPPELSDTALYLDDYSDDRHLEYPENYVLSEWSWNRVYNYFVNGESRSYGYARSTYPQFIGGLDYDRWYDRLRGRVGYVVTTDLDDYEPRQLGAVLHRDHGSRTDAHRGVAHYRLVYASEGGRYKAFALVPGAVMQGQSAPGATVNASTRVDVPGASFTYVRQTTAGGAGNYSVRVAYPGTYEIDGATVTVPEQAVTNGTTVPVDSG